VDFNAANRRLSPKGSVSMFNPTLNEVDTINRWRSLIPSKENAVNDHQSCHDRFDSCYISTSRSFEKAEEFATSWGSEPGVVLTLDSSLFSEYGVEAFDLNDPINPHELEVTIKAKDNGVIPNEVIVEITEINI
jgi:hypothetical protein